MEAMPTPDTYQIRRAERSEAAAAAAVLLRARHAAVPSIPPLVHPDDEVTAWFAHRVMATSEVWVAEREGEIVGVMVLSGQHLDQLYVDPGCTSRGIGSALLDRAKTERPGRLELWTFQRNLGARRFYERHGFVEVDRTDGDNEEGEPDVKYRWP
jgi:GNAT superfamily N-acetyltransferase